MRRNSNIIGDMMVAFTLCSQVKLTIWQKEMSMMFMACSALDMDPFQLLGNSPDMFICYFI